MGVAKEGFLPMQLRELVSLCFFVSACADPAPAMLRLPPSACLEPWPATAHAWADALQPECEELDARILQRITDDMPCTEAAACTIGDTMYVRASLERAQQRAVTTHEWIHILSRCETDDADGPHLNEALWAGRDPEGIRGATVEARAVRMLCK